MTIRFFVDPGAATPPWEQLRDRVLDAVRDGSAAPGDRLPTVRGLAAQLHCAPGTVARAFRELERAGIVETRGRQGTFVAATDARADRAVAAAREYASLIAALGIDRRDALRYVEAALDSSASDSPGSDSPALDSPALDSPAT